jgi:alkanesulfonate monooxygenase SsuD/methylene tetrahydromethanopterin reductase-like flavin-dependent oxidoreductase (luciferase family)
MEAGVHLPLIDLDGAGFSLGRLAGTVDAARECGFAAVSANDHLLFPAPWLDGLTALAAVAGCAGSLELMTSLALPALRGPAWLAKALAALDLLSGGRVVAGVGPGSSRADYAASGVPFEGRWPRLDEAVGLLRSYLRPDPPEVSESGPAAPAAPTEPAAPPESAAAAADSLAELPLRPRPRREIPLWLGSWGSAAGLRRVARLGDGWLASAYNTTPAQFAEAAATLARLRAEQGHPAGSAAGFPHALVTMWTWVTSDRAEADRVLAEVIAPLVRRDPAELGPLICVGPAGQCADLLSQYARAGCQRVHFWPLGDERRQIELLAADVLPRVAP